MTYGELKKELDKFSDEQLQCDVTVFDGDEIIKCDDLILPEDIGVDLDLLNDFEYYPLLLQTQ